MMSDSPSLQELKDMHISFRDSVSSAQPGNFCIKFNRAMRDTPCRSWSIGNGYWCSTERKRSPEHKRFDELHYRIEKLAGTAARLEVNAERKGQCFIFPVVPFIGPTALDSVPWTVAEFSTRLDCEVNEARAEEKRLFKIWQEEASRYQKASSKGTSGEKWNPGHLVIKLKREYFAYHDKMRNGRTLMTPEGQLLAIKGKIEIIGNTISALRRANARLKINRRHEYSPSSDVPEPAAVALRLPRSREHRAGQTRTTSAGRTGPPGSSEDGDPEPGEAGPPSGKLEKTTKNSKSRQGGNHV